MCLTSCSLLTAYCSLLAAASLLAARCSRFAPHCWLLPAPCSLLAAHVPANSQVAVTMAAVLVLMSILFALASGAMATDGLSGNSLWSATMPMVPLPSSLREFAFSPVEDSPLAYRFAAAVARGAVFPSTSAVFCEAAELVCDSNIKIAAYGTQNEFAAARSSSIETINDLQFDFFLEEELVVGGEMKLSENLHDPIPMRPFLPRVVADALSAVTTANLPKLLQLFNIAEKSSMATMMGTAAYLCGSAALPGETKACPTTLPAMTQYVVSELGTSQVQALSTTGAPAEAPACKAPVTIQSVSKRSIAEGEQIIICHGVMFPSALFYCHHVKDTRIVQANLLASDKSIINAVGICHFDTSLWTSEHPAFKALNIPRGEEACHWLSANDVVWMSAATQ